LKRPLTLILCSELRSGDPWRLVGLGSPEGRGDRKQKAQSGRPGRPLLHCGAVGAEHSKKGVSPKRTHLKNTQRIRHEAFIQNTTWVRSTKRTQIQGGKMLERPKMTPKTTRNWGVFRSEAKLRRRMGRSGAIPTRQASRPTKRMAVGLPCTSYGRTLD